MGVENGEFFREGLGVEAGSGADSATFSSWVDGDFGRSWPERFVCASCLLSGLVRVTKNSRKPERVGSD